MTKIPLMKGIVGSDKKEGMCRGKKLNELKGGLCVMQVLSRVCAVVLGFGVCWSRP
jgi:hypothetical protein